MVDLLCVIANDVEEPSVSSRFLNMGVQVESANLVCRNEQYPKSIQNTLCLAFLDRLRLDDGSVRNIVRTYIRIQTSV